ncbi:SRPBCC family protein, partial [Streptomyces sp. YGL11-2]|uniref:SRPBCC family protein n=1 Tax=Streptomyces sp. YGL11-2 TaxID=3414028 RepID=UPI003CF6AE39
PAAGGRTALRMERRLAHPPHEVWSALTDPARTGRWFPCDVAVELRTGGPITFLMPQVSGPAMTGTVTDVEEPRLYAFTWGDDHLRWEVAPDPDGSLLTLVHTFGDRFGAASFASGWHLCLSALAQLLDGESPAVEPDSGELHEAYLEQFDLGHGAVEETTEGPRIRFERQLVRPAETVWAVLTGGDEPAAGEPAPGGVHLRKGVGRAGHRGAGAVRPRLPVPSAGDGPLGAGPRHRARRPPGPDADRTAGRGRGGGAGRLARPHRAPGGTAAGDLSGVGGGGPGV